MAGGASDNDEDMITAINVTPLVDVVLVLLIILMVTASYVVSKSIPMDLPSAATGEGTPQSIKVSLTRAGQLYVDAEAVSEEQLIGRIRSYAASAGAEARAVIAADEEVTHGKVTHIIDLLRRERITKFAINTQPLENAPAAP